MNKAVEEAIDKIEQYISETYAYQDLDSICSKLSLIVGERCESYYPGSICPCYSQEKYNQLQTVLATINEKEDVRKSKGVFYTPYDVVHFITSNCIKATFGCCNADSLQDYSISKIPIEEFCLKRTFLEPTCGAGEFLLAVLNYKLDAWNALGNEISAEIIAAIVSTLHGNDINQDSITITKLRIFLLLLEKYGVEAACASIGNINEQFTSVDFVNLPDDYIGIYDVILGNPPYVEDNKYGDLEDRYGNIYCNVLYNASKHLTKNGVLGFIIPLSYIATPRMKKIRDRLFEVLPRQIILSYADRPDCLFTSVHQKLCILFAQNGDSKLTYTSNYKYWYKEERIDLFHNIETTLNSFAVDDFIPKLGTRTDVCIYEKITQGPNRESVFEISRRGAESVYLNRRETFWIKAFRTPHIHPEFKVFSFQTAGEADYCYCLVNSSLFWWYWISVSDCWHVSRELNGFKAPRITDYAKATDLANALANKLEDTKVYVGTKQTDYEYKHNACIEEIHNIDDYINSLFGLTEEESLYIKNFAYRYRISGGVTSDECN